MLIAAPGSGHAPCRCFGGKGALSPILQLGPQAFDLLLCELPLPNFHGQRLAAGLTVANPAFGNFRSVHGAPEGREEWMWRWANGVVRGLPSHLHSGRPCSDFGAGHATAC